ncbi:MAG: ThuA domain-containing protein [Cyclobacteriaceae bacterium]
MTTILRTFQPVQFLFCILAIFFFTVSCDDSETPERRVLVFSKTEGYRHESIETGVETIKKLGEKKGFEVDATEDASVFNEENLKNYAAVIFLNTTQNVLDYYQQADFERYIQAGGGFVGIHAAADTEYEWSWYGRLVGAYFKSHPSGLQTGMIEVDHSHAHPSLESIPESFEKTDEIYNFKNINPDINVLMSVDESTYKGGENPDFHPMTWYHEYDGGRAFYTNFGHNKETYSEPLFLKIITGGIEYAMAKKPLDYSKVKSDRLPEENRFVQTVLAESLDEPMEMDVLDKYSVIFVQRKGEVRVLNTISQKIKTVAQIPVYTGQEDGLIGVAVDPDYKNTNWVYVIYSPPGDEPKQNVSRFVFDGDNFDLNSEELIFEIPTQRDECCHSGGSLEFDKHGNLYISIGDDTNPFKSNGYNPTDERPGRSPWDAQKSSANTNDLRGKILRIKPEMDGSYSIPEGNLFPPGTPKTRPEIYVMGCRNPYRISVDEETGFLYWGDVGPDAGKFDSLRGPAGHDEINQARNPGFWGWPYSRGNNKMYANYDFETGESAEAVDPNKPINESPYNTGKRELPPIQKSFIWYPYDKSEEFPWVGKGGRTAMAGPVYYSKNYAESKVAFPDYFDGKLFVYEWVRNWIYIITMDEEGNYVKEEPFMQNNIFSRPSDMVFGPDGSLYILEYGKVWFKPNFDARLSKVEYISGNRPPIARISSDVRAGAAPLTVNFSAEESVDYDGDPLSYEWKFDSEDGTQYTSKNVSHTFDKEGTFKVELSVKDSEGKISIASREISVGNAAPEVKIELEDTTSLFVDNGKVSYKVSVTDKEDGSTMDGTIDPERILVTLHYIPQGNDLTVAAQGHQIDLTPKGKAAMDASDCKSCHALDKRINGPSFNEIAKRYTAQSADYLVKKVLNGGSGVWGETVMSAHPQLSNDEVKLMVDYILSLKEGKKEDKNKKPASGTIEFVEHIKKRENDGIYLLKATYMDNGTETMSPLSSSDQFIWRKKE